MNQAKNYTQHEIIKMIKQNTSENQKLIDHLEVQLKINKRDMLLTILLTAINFIVFVSYFIVAN